MLLAAAVSMIFIGLWDYFYAFPEMDRQKKVIAEQERLAKMLEATTSIRMLTPPIDLPVVHESMVWHERRESDPGHQWLRQMLAAFAADF